MDPVSIPVLALILFSIVYSLKRKVPFIFFIAIVNFLIFLYFIIMVVLYPWKIWPLYNDLALRPETAIGPKAYTFVTHIFMHGSLLHILGNTIFLVFFGLPFEQRIGTRKIAIIYIASGIMAGVLDTAASYGVFHDTHIFRVGASGAIFGIMGAYLATYPNDRILMPLIILVQAPVWIGVLVYGAFETWLVITLRSDGIGHMAHVGGLVTGLVLGPLIAGELAGKKVISIPALHRIAKGPRAKELLVHIETEDIDDVREAWIDQFAEVTICPVCGEDIVKYGDKFGCTKCDWETRFRFRAKRKRGSPFS